MNDKRRKKLAEAQKMLQYAQDFIEQVLDDEQDALANIPENMSERIERSEDTISDLESARDSIGEAVQQLDEAASR